VPNPTPITDWTGTLLSALFTELDEPLTIEFCDSQPPQPVLKAKVESCYSNLRRPCGATIPRSSSKARKWLISAVRSDTSRSRARCSA
jgi:hypothetical protein